jgi:hypothetical protein
LPEDGSSITDFLREMPDIVLVYFTYVLIICVAKVCFTYEQYFLCYLVMAIVSGSGCGR